MEDPGKADSYWWITGQIIGDIIRVVMVNLAHCTKITFDFQVIHIIHIDFPHFGGFLSTPKGGHFSGKSSYAPSYPHYPQFFSIINPFSPKAAKYFIFVKMS